MKIVLIQASLNGGGRYKADGMTSDAAYLRCNPLKGKDHSALHLALHHHSRTRCPVQLRILG